MKLKKFINEKKDIEKSFVRLGPMSGQKQKHKGSKRAPAKKGVWLLPIQAARDLAFLGGFQKDTKRLEVKEKDYPKEYGMTYDEYCELPYKEMERLDNIVYKRKMKLHYKRIELKNTDFVWTHLGKGAPEKIIGDEWSWPWYKVSVREYWELFKREFGKQLKNKTSSIDGEWAEVFWETT